MMGCGKSSIAKAMAKLYQKKAVDIDHLIEKRIGCSISAFFEKNGEEAFRKIESEVLCEVCKQDEQIIATGGGIILNPENIRIMQKNGWIVFIDRPIHTIAKNIRTSTRPLLKNGMQPLFELYAKRKALYKSACDFHFRNRYSNSIYAAKALARLLGIC